MKPERWQQLNKLFHGALERATEQRSAFLDEACAGDEALRKQVEALLTAHDGAGSFIERPAVEVESRSLADDQNELAAEQTIGHYKIISQLGVGEMGKVYLAEDTTLGRKVRALQTSCAASASAPNCVQIVSNEANLAMAHDAYEYLSGVGAVDEASAHNNAPSNWI
jgi:eukaryotic-like serine/threonine-protein kinase